MYQLVLYQIIQFFYDEIIDKLTNCNREISEN